MSHSYTGAGVVIVGAGEAGTDVASALRQMSYAGPIIMIGDEQYAPYRRPPLSKAFLSGEATLDSLYLRSAETYVRQRIDCRFGIGVETIDRAHRQLRLYDGTVQPYEHLVLATGGRARRLALPGANHSNVHYLRTIDDILRMKDQFVPGKRLLIVGGGYIGLEVASVGIKKGLKVSLVEALPRVLARVTAPELSAFYEKTHRSHGVAIRTGIGVHAMEGDPLVDTVVLSDGSREPADLVLVGIGLIPNTELAETAGLQVSNGIVVDAHSRTLDPAIYAVGDCSNHENTFYGRHMRLESVPNAAEQARVCAATICGKLVQFSAVPWFWSDQYNLKLQMVGLSQGYDEIAIRGDLSKGAFSAYYLKGGIVMAADAVNRPADFIVAKKLVAARGRATVEQLNDESAPLKALLPGVTIIDNGSHAPSNDEGQAKRDSDRSLPVAW